jgi:cytochrome b561
LADWHGLVFPVVLVGLITLHLTAVLTRHFLNRRRTAVRCMLG